MSCNRALLAWSSPCLTCTRIRFRPCPRHTSQNCSPVRQPVRVPSPSMSASNTALRQRLPSKYSIISGSSCPVLTMYGCPCWFFLSACNTMLSLVVTPSRPARPLCCPKSSNLLMPPTWMTTRIVLASMPSPNALRQHAHDLSLPLNLSHPAVKHRAPDLVGV
jgi:hypothetical protein